MLTLVGNEVFKRNGLRTDESALKVTVDHARSLRGRSAHAHSPGAHFLHTGGEVGLQTQQLEAGTDQAVQTGLFQAQLLQEHVAVFIVHLGHFRFDLGANRHHRRTLSFGISLELVQQRVVLKTIFGHIAHKHGGLGCDQAERLEQGRVFLGHGHHAGRLAFVQCCLDRLQQGHQLGSFLVIARTRGLGVAVQRLLHSGQVGQAQLGLDHFNVGNRVNLVRHVDHVGVFKATHHVHNRVGFADVGQELVAQAFALGSASHQACDVHKLHNRGHDALGRDDLSQLVQAGIGHLHHTSVRLNRAEGVIFSSNAGFSQGVKEGGLAHVGQAHDAALEAHGISFGINALSSTTPGWRKCPIRIAANLVLVSVQPRGLGRHGGVTGIRG